MARETTVFCECRSGARRRRGVRGNTAGQTARGGSITSVRWREVPLTETWECACRTSTCDDMDDADTALGAGITIVGVSISVVGLNYMKLHGTHPLPWKMERTALLRWFGAFLGWGTGQVIMLFGVQFALQSGAPRTLKSHVFSLHRVTVVCSAVANVALIVNAYVANKLFAEPFRVYPPPCGAGRSLCGWLLSWDLLSMVFIIAGAGSVVLTSPEMPDTVDGIEQATLSMSIPPPCYPPRVRSTPS